MASVIQSGLVPILNAIQKQLISAVPAVASQIKFTSHREDPPHFDADHDIVVRVGSFIAFDGGWAASTAQRVRRFLTVYPRTRLSLDPADRDTQWMLSIQGHFTWEEKVLRALWGYFPNDAQDSTTGNLITQMEMQMAAGTDPVKGAIDKAWGDSAITFELEYLFALGQPSVTG
jgi:hypothetical protein